MTIPSLRAAPFFQALDQDGNLRSLTDFRSRIIVLYFYPKDDTPGCTKEACGIRDLYDEISRLATVIGVSKDSVASHKKFATKYHLPFILLSDTNQDIAAAYKVDGILLPKRTTFLIDSSGQIVKVYEKVTPQTHAATLLNDLKTLSSE